MFSTAFDYEKIDWSQLLKKKSLEKKSMKGRGEEEEPFSSHQEGEGLGQVLKEKVPKFLASPVGREITQGFRDVSSSMASGTSLGKALRKTGRKAIRNLIGIGAKNTISQRGVSTRTRKADTKQQKKPVRSIRNSPRKRLHFIPPLN